MDKKTIKNYIYNMSYQILLVIVPLITTPYISRVLKPYGVGVYSYTWTIATAFSLFAALGVNVYGQREIAYRQDNKHKRSIVFWELLSIRAITTIIIGIMYIAFCLMYHQYSIYLLEQAFIVFAVFLDISWFFQGIENFRIIAVRNIIVKIITVILIFVLVKNENHVGRYILINSISVFSSYAVFFLNLKKEIEKPVLSELCISRHFRGCIEFLVPLLAVQLYSQLDKIMIGAITGDTIQNGYYEQARKIVNVLIMVITSINNVMYPRISSLYAKDQKAEIKKMYSVTFKIIVLMVVPMTIGLYFVSDNFVAWFFGDGYEPVGLLLKLSGLLLIFMGVGNFVGLQYLSPTGQQNQMTKVYIVSAVINFCLNLIVIRKFLAVGALVASIVAELISATAQMVLIQKSELRFNYLDEVWKYVVSGTVMGIALLILQRITPCTGIIETVIEVAVGGMIYIVMLNLLKESTIKNVIKKIKRN